MLSLLLALALAAPGEAVTWSFDQPADLQSTVHLLNPEVSGGLTCGLSEWDPFIYLAVPFEGLDADRLTRLTVRLYSSAPADQLSVYYKSNDGCWGLSSTVIPIVAGLAEYRLDLTKLEWRESSPQEGSKRWGGATRQVNVFRLDPGNQEGRFIAFAEVKLAPADDTLFEVGSTLLTKPGAKLGKLTATPQVAAGQPIRLSAEFDSTVTGDDHAVFWLRGEGGLWATAVVPLTLEADRQTIATSISTLQYAQAAKLTARVGLLGTTLDGAGFDQPLATVALSNPLAGRQRAPLTEVKPLGGDPALFVDGQPIAPFFVSVNGLSKYSQKVDLGRSGVHLYSDWFGGSMGSDLGHLAPDTYDYSAFDTYFAEALEADPDAWFLPHIGITPPSWWQQAHPEELCLYADGSHGPQSFASLRWRRDTGEDLRRLIAHLESAPYAGRILGYLPFSGYSAEWQSWGLWQNHLADYSEPAQAAWKSWLIARYGDRAANVPLPTPEQRHAGEFGLLRDPYDERFTIDFYQFLADLTVGAIEDFCGMIKEATGRRSIVGTYYGYLTQHQYRQQDSSHLGLKRLLDCPDLDFLLSPPLYTDRQYLGTAGFMSATESVRHHGKLWLSEADYRTQLSAASSGYGRTATEAESVAVLRREMANVLTRRTGVSWYDMVGGWLAGDFPAELGRLRQLQQQSLVDRRPFHGELCVVLDERSYTYLTAMHPLLSTLVLNTITTLPKVGVSWDFVLLDDLADADLGPYRCYLFLNAVTLDDEQRGMLRERLSREQSTAIWVYAAGYYSSREIGDSAMTDITGYLVREEPWDRALRAVGPDGEVCAGEQTGVEHVYVPNTNGADVFAQLEGTDWPAVARKPVGDWTSIWTSVPKLSPELLRKFAKDAGCHVYLNTGDPLYVDDRYVGLQAMSDGDRTVDLLDSNDVWDALTGERVPAANRRVRLTMTKGEMRVLRLR